MDDPIFSISSDGEYFVVAQDYDRKSLQLFSKDSSQREWYWDCSYGNVDCVAKGI